MKLFLLLLGPSAACTAGKQWVVVAPKTFIPGTALAGGRQYTMEEADHEFATTIASPGGGVCLIKRDVPEANSTCEHDAGECAEMEACMYRKNGGRWLHLNSEGAVLSGCFSNCSNPAVFCDQSRCSATMGCNWFVKTQSSQNECFCRDYSNTEEKIEIRKIWRFWHQPLAIPVFLLAIVAGGWILYNVWLFNIRPYLRRLQRR